MFQGTVPPPLKFINKLKQGKVFTDLNRILRKWVVQARPRQIQKPSEVCINVLKNQVQRWLPILV